MIKNNKRLMALLLTMTTSFGGIGLAKASEAEEITKEEYHEFLANSIEILPSGVEMSYEDNITGEILYNLIANDRIDLNEFENTFMSFSDAERYSYYDTAEKDGMLYDFMTLGILGVKIADDLKTFADTGYNDGSLTELIDMYVKNRPDIEELIPTFDRSEMIELAKNAQFKETLSGFAELLDADSREKGKYSNTVQLGENFTKALLLAYLKASEKNMENPEKIIAKAKTGFDLFNVAINPFADNSVTEVIFLKLSKSERQNFYLTVANNMPDLSLYTLKMLHIKTADDLRMATITTKDNEHYQNIQEYSLNMLNGFIDSLGIGYFFEDKSNQQNTMAEIKSKPFSDVLNELADKIETDTRAGKYENNVKIDKDLIKRLGVAVKVLEIRSNPYLETLLEPVKSIDTKNMKVIRDTGYERG